MKLSELGELGLLADLVFRHHEILHEVRPLSHHVNHADQHGDHRDAPNQRHHIGADLYANPLDRLVN